MLNNVLQDTFDLSYVIQVYHRRTLNMPEAYNLHSQLGDIKDYAFGVLDKIGEYIIKKGEDIEQYNINWEAKEKECETIYKDSLSILRGYIDSIISYYTKEKDLRVQNYLIEVADDLEQMYAKLQSSYELD